MKSTTIVKYLALLLIFQNSEISFSQPPENHNISSLSPGFYKSRRDTLRKMMPPNSVFVLFAAPERTFSSDVDYLYHQNPDLTYFTGYTEPNSMMYIFKEGQKIEGFEKPVNEILFTPPVNDISKLFSGKKDGPAEVMKELEIRAAVETSKFEEFPIDLSQFDAIITDLLPSDVREGSYTYSLSGLIKTFKENAGIRYVPNSLSMTFINYFNQAKNEKELKQSARGIKAYLESDNGKLIISPVLTRFISAPDSLKWAMIKDSIANDRIKFEYFNHITSSLRQVKTDEEIEVIKKAIEITCKGHREVMKALTPEMSEREIQGIHEFIYKLNGAKETGFALIIASGNNGCTLHYQDNDAPRVGNNLVLMDVGAMFSGYSADVTRTIPANGRFSPEQLAVYNIVLEAQDSAFSYCRKGLPYATIDLAGRRVISEGLKKLGIIKENNQSYLYYPHSISHPIGLDVHDKNTGISLNSLLSNNMIITLEPGIYIPVGSDCDKKWWGIAVRIEDDVLINDNNPVNLSLQAPRKAIDIEKLMRKSSPFNQFK